MALPKFKIESGAQLLARLTKKSDVENIYPILFPSAPKPGDLIEFYGNSHCQCLLLIDIICNTLISNNFSDNTPGVLIIKTDGKLDFVELINILRKKISTYNNSEIDLENLLRNILNKLYILEIYDATQFYTTIHNLDNILMEHGNIAFIICDTITAFYWSEQGFKITKMDFYLKTVLQKIQNVTKDSKVICIYTKPEYFCSSKDSENLETDELLVTEPLNYRVQVVNKNNSRNCHVNVRTRDTYFEKYFNIINNEIKWQ